MPTYVALSSGLEHLAATLKQHGFTIVDVENNTHTPAALIYSRKGQGQEHEARPLRPGGNNTGLTMLIDADTTSEEEIIQILTQNRL